MFYFILELPDKEYIKQVVTNITKEEMKNTVNLLLKGLIIDYQVLISSVVPYFMEILHYIK